MIGILKFFRKFFLFLIIFSLTLILLTFGLGYMSFRVSGSGNSPPCMIQSLRGGCIFQITISTNDSRFIGWLDVIEPSGRVLKSYRVSGLRSVVIFIPKVRGLYAFVLRYNGSYAFFTETEIIGRFENDVLEDAGNILLYSSILYIITDILVIVFGRRRKYSRG